MLKITNVTKTFNPGTITEKKALLGIDLTLEDGDFVTVIGGNGAGKSTLLNLIAGVHSCDTGKIELNGINMTNMPEYRRAKYLGRVFQDPMLGTAANMEIEENLAMAFRRGKTRSLAWGIKNSERNLYYEKLELLGLGLEKRMHSKVGLLSGGQRQALTLLMSTLQKPDLLLLDEHTAALDPKTASRVLELTKKFIEEDHLTAFMVTHNMMHAIEYGNRLIMMMNGKIVYDVRGEEKKNLKVDDLLAKFGAAGEMNDRMMLESKAF
ncbi:MULTISPECIES: ABC transporter ATP-binding protein [Treponema]|jgi:putative ABC transport system ATP-binding protein|uniref:Putative ABC transport system ATP-binding protein n=1 Tax=Treponema berlinense TaxID=225004 RepID=A0A1T4LG60_9SPIR|nr:MULTISPECIES: ATP-binding cassette domain-containing protein [Treponema]MBQ9101626.1 ATP-binding cassette domain-containing protein [Treponema sp.]MCI5540883.1 ATP-binding cassette domain-containing protein [Treponema berlinense]MDD5833652.1 ATP-binding cassette domain-containing protein [Treponema berlinense]MDY3707128.1 ATP-binding cassette domain-containing protein [Treponema berlinense]SJZ53568.1 putative ABC transport system ATP-binding protein [Treponema berlinense]